MQQETLAAKELEAIKRKNDRLKEKENDEALR